MNGSRRFRPCRIQFVQVHPPLFELEPCRAFNRVRPVGISNSPPILIKSKEPWPVTPLRATNSVKVITNGRFQKISIPYNGPLLGFPKGRGGVHDYGILRALGGGGGIYDWISEDTGEFHRWDFWSRQCRVSSLKMLL